MLSTKNPTSCVKKTTILFVLSTFCLVGAFSQSVVPQLPEAAVFKNYGASLNSHQNTLTDFEPSIATTINRNKHAQQMAVYEADARRVAKAEEIRQMAIKDAEAHLAYGPRLGLPTFRNQKGTQHYRNAYAQLLSMVGGPFSTRKATFIIENAYYEGEKDYSEFEHTIKQTGDFLRERMKEMGLSAKSNLAKNYLLFQFFADTLETKSNGIKHFPFSYDFDDYWGKKDWSKMFVHKLLLTGKGQCSSLPKLYLILAEEIGAVAHLALSPNHSYIKFPDDDGRWHNIELTNNMLTTDAFILNSGFVKSEAIQNKIFMHPMNQRELLSNHFDQLALGYIRKYGYDDFVEQVLNTALELNPKNITARLSKANLQTIRLKYATEKMGIDQDNFGEIRNYPELVQLYKSVMFQYESIDNLGYAEMPPELYEKWLASVDEEGNKKLNESFKITPTKAKKD